MKKPRVALVALHFAEYAANLALALSDKWEVFLVIYRKNADNELGEKWDEWLSRPSLTVLALEQPLSVVSIIKNTRSLVSNIKRFRPDVIHYQEGLRDEIALSLPFFFAIPKVLTVHDPASHSGTDSIRLRFSRYRLYRLWMRRAIGGVITHGALLTTELEKICPWLKGKIVSVPHGPLGTHTNKKVAIKPKGYRLLFFGRIHEYKGLRYFVDAVIRLRNEGFPVTGVVAGRGSDLDRYRVRMEEAGCFQVLDRYIPAAEVHTLFSEAWAIVLPYTDGTQSGVAALALGFERPVVASAVGSIPELVRHGQNGLLVPPSDLEALVHAIRLTITTDGLWCELSDGAKKLRDGELSWRTIADATGRVYVAAAS
jgi:starch synthase